MELNIKDFMKEMNCESVLFKSETPGDKVDLETLIYEKLWVYEDIKPSEIKLHDDKESWKKIAIALASALIVDYGELKND